jgi:hypothetical protein
MSVQPRTAQIISVALADLAAASDLLTNVSGNPAFATVTAASALIVGDRVIAATNAGSSYALTLPLASVAGAGYVFEIKKTDGNTNAIVVTAAGSDHIDGATTKTLATQYDYLKIISDGVSSWLVFAAVLT